MSSEDDTRIEHDLEHVLRKAGRRPEPPAELLQSVRTAVESEWRSVVAQRTRRRRTALWSMAAGIVLAVAGAWYLLPLAQSGGPEMAQLSTSSGSVRGRNGSWGRWVTLGQRGPVNAGEVLATGSDGRAALVLAGEVSLRLDHDTRIAFVDPRHVTIERGAVYVDSGTNSQPDNERLQIETPAGAVRHVGTQYEVRLVDTGVRIAVREGKVELNTKAGDTQHAVAGELMTVSGSGTIHRAALSRDDPSWVWAAEAAPRFDIDGRPLADFLAWAGRETGRDVVFASPEIEAEASRVILSGSIEGLGPAAALTAVLPTTPLRGEERDGQLVISFAAAAQ